MCVCACVCACICVREREREGERECLKIRKRVYVCILDTEITMELKREDRKCESV